MKTKELIKQLQELDPSGELDVCVGNVDIYFVSKEPAYWDGRQQILVRDEKGYVVGAKYNCNGSKIQVHCMSICDLLWDKPNAVIDYSDLPDYDKEKYMSKHKQISQKSKDIGREVEFDGFFDHIKSRVIPISDIPLNDIKRISKDFFDKHLSPDDPILVEIGKSYRDCRYEQWNKKVNVKVDYNGLELSLND